MILITKREEKSLLNKITGVKQEENLKLEDLQTDQDIQFKYCTSISLEGLEVIDVEHHEVESAFALKEIDSDKIVCLFSAESGKSKTDFLHDVDDAVWKRLQAWRSISFGSMEVSEPSSTAEGEPNKRGLLHKQKRNGDWKVKLCELVGSEFRWYDPAGFKDNKQVAQSLFTLKASNVTLWPVMDRPFCFVITVPRGSYYFSAESGTERLVWINSIRNAIRNAIRKQLQDIKETKDAEKKPGKEEKKMEKEEKKMEKEEKITEKEEKKSRSSSVLSARGEKTPAVLASIKKGGKLRSRTLSKGTKKKVTLFKEHQPDKYKKYSAVVKEGRLFLEKDKKEQSIELLLLHTIDTHIEEVTTKEPGSNLFVFEIIGDTRKDRLGVETREEAQDWTDRLYNAHKELHKTKKKK